ncbi:hypothetical protein P8452_18817 [Trifolium repens]|nr:hypothetical protein P8452_18817 [Trifolium repens]
MVGGAMIGSAIRTTTTTDSDVEDGGCGGPKSRSVKSLTCSDDVPTALFLAEFRLVCVTNDGVPLDLWLQLRF